MSGKGFVDLFLISKAQLYRLVSVTLLILDLQDRTRPGLDNTYGVSSPFFWKI